MSIPLPVFIAIPLTTAFFTPVCGKKLKPVATALANLATLSLVVLAAAVIGQSGVYKIGKWPIPLGIDLVLDGLSGLMLLVVNVVSFAAMLFSTLKVARLQLRTTDQAFEPGGLRENGHFLGLLSQLGRISDRL